MNPNLEKIINDFKQCVKKMNLYNEAIGLIHWDMRTKAPRRSVPHRSETVGMLSGETFRMLVSEQMGEWLKRLNDPETQAQLDETTRKMAAEYGREYERSRNIPPEEYERYVVLASEAESAWESHKPSGDFAAIRPYLQQLIDFNRKFIEYWGYEEHPYEALLEPYEPGMKVAQLERVFTVLKKELVPLVSDVANRNEKPETGFLRQPFDEEKQRKFSHYILEQMGYDFDAGRLDESVHPFAIGLNPGDVRITTAFREDDFTFSLFSSIHEGGHALYEQNIDEQLHGTGLRDGASMGIHESQSRLWENVIGRSYPFWEKYYPELKRFFPGQFDDVSLDDFYRAINAVSPSLIRIEADELTYNLHIMIRYELEKALFENELQADDLPAAWNEKYEAYLGVTPAHDGEGVMQDVHWYGGAFGYFPSYSLGNMYAAQFMSAIKKQLDVDRLIAQGDLAPIRQWLIDHVCRYGKLRTPDELVRGVSGESLNPVHLIAYFREKFGEVYRL